ncbi:hypothetical protein KIW84_061827 [Lathyrus oleraceus]|uniref:Uncharacterized protein n=1 Tax=Pisum sativum TaxID=3888 RepID=A0A9D5A500_PEA|nr:hypothetical protein KIW84_061827 [Pisum sativum]
MVKMLGRNQKGNYCRVPTSTGTVPQAWEKCNVAKRKALTEATNFQQFNVIEITRKISAFLQSYPQATPILPKVEEVIAKERDLQEKLMAKHSTVVDCYEKEISQV